LAGEVEFQALGDIPLPFTPNRSRKWSLHDLIVPQARVLRAVGRTPRSLGGVGHWETDHYQGVEPPELRLRPGHRDRILMRGAPRPAAFRPAARYFSRRGRKIRM
jgi:hypothetical protein